MQSRLDPHAIAVGEPARPRQRGLGQRSLGHQGSGAKARPAATRWGLASWWAVLQRQRRHGLLGALSLLLLIAQQGGFVHELSHHLPPRGAAVVAAAAGLHEHGRDADRDHDGSGSDEGSTCTLCLAFASVDALATPAAFEPPLLNGLCHAWGPATAFAVRHGAAPAPRSRGPPDLI